MKTNTKYIIFLGAISLLAGACGPTTDQTGIESDTANSLAWNIDFKEIKAQEEGCSGEQCTHVSLQIPILSGGDSVATDEINQQTEGEIREMIKARLPDPMAMGTWESLAESFIEGYSMFAMEFPDNPGKWYIELDSEESEITDSYFTLQLKVSEFMGGAHPSTYTLLKTYNLTTGDVVDIIAVVDTTALRIEAEKRFREAHDLAENALLNDGGFMFPDGRFILPENMGITKDGVLLIYNAYEVASYAEGQTVFTIPFSALRSEQAAAN